MNEVYPVKVEIELYPAALEAMESIREKTGVSKSEIIEKMFLKYMPLDEERATELIIDDIATRTERLSAEKKKLVYSKVAKFIEAECK